LQHVGLDNGLHFNGAILRDDVRHWLYFEHANQDDLVSVVAVRDRRHSARHLAAVAGGFDRHRKYTIAACVRYDSDRSRCRRCVLERLGDSRAAARRVQNVLERGLKPSRVKAGGVACSDYRKC